ncbi:hypothetical protein [Halopiger xanaduensis]|uniref:Uncharacterized protein n=1 Tax=Halopiger xanaduensis (strain DSM 18323 / JCM 14033 / SH-6) TaxID=797210 RepID=F8DAK4_HALXS|nr:hypothetical protein [Halopiger xanaduensis]AEH35809.1 hypothetical protein Halxa_1176 [Halopiger xanaduensis SH-6]
MRALRNCDFCDAEAVGAFEVVPPELEPTEAEQRRVVLCGDCEVQLETLLEPLLARVGAASTDAGSGADAGSDSDANADSNSGTVVAAADETTQKRRRTTSPNATVSDGDSSATADGTPADAPTSDSEPKSEPGITFETDEADIADSSAGQSDPDAAIESGDESADTTESTETTARPSESEVDPDSSDASETGGATDASESRPPRAYGKVIRLLRNREFPVARADAAELAAGAYDLEPAAVDAIIDHAIENDEFVERDGELHRA